MGNKGRRKNQPVRFLGVFTLPEGQTAVGELILDGSKTILKLHSGESLGQPESSVCVTGAAYSGESITLLDSINHGSGVTWSEGSPPRYNTEVFPHYAAIGRHHIDPTEKCITSVNFTTNDLATLFYDFDAFGHVIDAKSVIDDVLHDRRAMRPVETGESPHIAYFTGKFCIAEVNTRIGKISVHHRPRFNMGGPSGVYIKNRIVISIEPETPTDFGTAIDSVYEICCFLSMAAGRTQGIDQLEIGMKGVDENTHLSLDVFPSLRWKVGGGRKQNVPSPGDVPLDPIHRRDEFDRVLANWISRHTTWREARGRYLGCLRKANKFDPDRIVAAANMFDILPSDAIPTPAVLSDQLSGTLGECKRMLRALPKGPDRDSALSALGRIGGATLRNKIEARTALIESKIPGAFPDLNLVAAIAVKCRNFYVHGRSDDFNFERFQAHIPFLTNALEFIFAASDMVEAGWDIALWNGSPKGWGHTFAGFRNEYGRHLAELRQALATPEPVQ